MSQTPVKKITQIVNKGKPIGPAMSAPDWFIHDHKDIAGASTTWGTLFSEPQSGNKAAFFVTGADYFQHVANAIENAKKSVFITGWQVNFDLEMDASGKTLLQVLDKAIDNGATIYVMPWLSPKAGVDTGDLETLLALMQLNAGRPAPQRAFVLPAIQQSDMPGALGMFFSHHQKLVVIDNEQAYLGGIDLAYGRRDDGRYLLSMDGRQGNECYNSCIPPTKKFTAVEQSKYLTRAELLAACFGDSAAWLGSAPGFPLAEFYDFKATISDKSKDVKEYVRQWWINHDLTPKIYYKAEDWAQKQIAETSISVVESVSMWAWGQLPAALQDDLIALEKTGGKSAIQEFAAVMAWLKGADINLLPPALLTGVSGLTQGLMIKLIREFSVAADRRETRYENLTQLKKILPKGAVGLDDNQPRMPWQDVQVCIEGPAVFDLAMNFIKRWDGMTKRYQQKENELDQTRLNTVNLIMKAIGWKPQPVGKQTTPPPIPEIPAEYQPNRGQKVGSCWVQTLRSASTTMLRDEGETSSVHAQNNCLKAMLTAIAASQHFVYIEGQFFQSDYGVEQGYKKDIYSGPMACLRDIRYSPGYERYADMLGIRNVPLNKIPDKIRWEKIDDVMRDMGTTKGEEFIADLKFVLANIAQGEFSKKLGKVQTQLANPLLHALLTRIERAIADGLDYHVYLVLPVHPEGPLNLMNIMHQTHLTMQSLSFGNHSLINGIRRAILTVEMCIEQKIKLAEARARVKELTTENLYEKIGDRWRDYLTLLNLRNWEMIKNRPVTEQIYVHSKLLIADDRVAILGSANINDRSQLGDRDSELAVIIRDDHKAMAPLTGKNKVPVSQCVHELRTALWKKHFGLTGGYAPATQLAGMIDKPAAPATWKAIQKVADDNANNYEEVFMFIPRNQPASTVQPGPLTNPDTNKNVKPACSIWPTWKYNAYFNHQQGGQLKYRMPFDDAFWRAPEIRDPVHTWNASATGTEAIPIGILGFIVSLPHNWTAGENNISPLNLAVLAETDGTQSPHTTLSSLLDDNNPIS